MNELPLQLIIKRIPEKQTETLTCTALLREIAGRRQVYTGLWNNKDVIVKIFSHKIRAKQHLKREWRGLNLLRSRGLNCPEALFYGKTKNNKWVLVTEKIANSSTVLELFSTAKNKEEKLNLLMQVGGELAKQHKDGVLQKDLHLGNFLLAENKIFALDFAQMRFYPTEIPRKKSISQLALLECYLSDDRTDAAEKLREEYALGRKWQLNEQDKTSLQKWLILHRKKGIRNELKKCLRTSKRYVRVKTGNYVAVTDKNFCGAIKLSTLIKQVDMLMNKGQPFKDGNTCYVSRISWNNKDIVVKRYNHKGMFHSLCHTIKRSRARRCWVNGHRLLMLGISTPKPLAFIEEYRGPFVWKSYIITEYVCGQKLCDFLRNNPAEQERAEITKQVKQLLGKLWKHHITHGDLKHSNILITDNGPVLTDLDSVQIHKLHPFFKKNQKKDVERLGL